MVFNSADTEKAQKQVLLKEGAHVIKNLLAAFMILSISSPLVAGQAIFAGGSFWVMEALFAERVGITKLEVGWIQASRQQTRRQVVRVEYDTEYLSYGDLLNLYWATIDAQDGEGQYCDRGAEFSPALYVETPLQQRWAQQSRATQALALEHKLAVRILPLGHFMPAKARHQHYYRQHPWLYGIYRRQCGYPALEKLAMPDHASGPFATTVLSVLR